MPNPLVLMTLGMLADAAPCEQLTSLALPNTRIMSAQLVAAGAFTPPAPQAASCPGVAPNAQPGAQGGGGGGQGGARGGATMGGRQGDLVRLFMAPGMQHCGGGPGPDQANWMAALERWRETGTPSDMIEAARVTNNRVDMTRPLWSYLQVAQYKGVGSSNDATNFVCRAK
jgi:hypothetical protein